MRSSLFLAFGFLTTVPVPQVEYKPGALGRAAPCFPLVGLAIGALLTVAHWLLSRYFSPLLVAALITTLWAAITGGLHLDGLADCCDGLLAAVVCERRLEIMRDPRLGAFGVIGVVLFLALKLSAIASLTSVLPALLLAPTWARWMLLLATRQPNARSGGLGDEFSSSVSRSTLVLAAILPVVLLTISFTLHSLIAGSAALLTTVFLLRAVRERLGGVTGDVYGLVIEMSELVMLIVFAGSVA